MKVLCAASFMTMLVGLSHAAQAADTTRLEVVREFIQELEVTHDLQVNATADNNVSQDTSDPAAANRASLANSVRHGTAAKLQLRTNVARLGAMKFTEKPYEQVIPTMVHWNRVKISLFDEMTASAKTFLIGPKPNVDYGKLAARMPEITAEMEFAEESISAYGPISRSLSIRVCARRK